MNERRVVVAASPGELAELVADKFLVRVRKICKRQGVSHVVLTGGTVAADIYRAIASHPDRSSVDWSMVHWWWSDERFVSRGDRDRNDQAAIDVLLGELPLDPSQIHTMPAESEVTDLDEAAADYLSELGRYATPGARFPDFDLALAGVGPDGHVLSVFPGSAHASSLDETVLVVTDSPKPPPRRLTMTLPLINRAKRVWLVASGAGKSSAIGLALAGASVVDVPASGLQGTQSTKVFIDEELAAGVPEDLVQRTRFWSADDERADYVPNALR